MKPCGSGRGSGGDIRSMPPAGRGSMPTPGGLRGMVIDSTEWYSSAHSRTPGLRQKREMHMSFGGRGSSYQWQRGTDYRGAPRVLKPGYDVLTRAMLVQMVNPPDTAISAPLQQAVSNFQSGDPGRAFGVGGTMVSRLSGRTGPTEAPGGGGDAGSPGTAGAGFAPGSFLPSASGGQQGLQTREQLGLPERSSYFTFMPSPEDIAKIGLSPIRSSIKNKDQLRSRIDKLQTQIDTREAAGKPHGQADKKIAKAKGQLAKNTGDLYWP